MVGFIVGGWVVGFGVAVGIGVRLGYGGGVWICRLWVALMVVRICIWVVFVFVFLVDGGIRMWVWVVIRLWV